MEDIYNPKYGSPPPEAGIPTNGEAWYEYTQRFPYVHLTVIDSVFAGTLYNFICSQPDLWMAHISKDCAGIEGLAERLDWSIKRELRNTTQLNITHPV